MTLVPYWNIQWMAMNLSTLLDNTLMLKSMIYARCNRNTKYSRLYKIIWRQYDRKLQNNKARHSKARRHIWAKSGISERARLQGNPMEHGNITWIKELLEKYGDVTLAIDIMAKNKIPFMISTSWNKHLGTAKLILNKTKPTLTSI